MTLLSAMPTSETDRLSTDDRSPHVTEGLQTLEFVGLDHQPPANAARAVPITSTEALANHPLRNVKARLTVCVGSLELTVGELMDARHEQVLRLDRTVEQPVDLLLEGQLVARGTLVAVGEYFGVRVTELPHALTP